MGTRVGGVGLWPCSLKKKATTTKLFITVITSCTQERKEGNKIVGGKHQETNTNQNQD